MVKTIKMGTPYKPKHSCDFEALLDEGQNPKGFTAETANGTAHAQDHPGWNQNPKTPTWPATPVGPWRNGNRTGE